MNETTITIREATDREMALHDDPILTFRNPYFGDHECIVIDLFYGNAPGDFGARCCICGQTTYMRGDTPLTVTPNPECEAPTQAGKL